MIWNENINRFIKRSKNYKNITEQLEVLQQQFRYNWIDAQKNDIVSYNVVKLQAKKWNGKQSNKYRCIKIDGGEKEKRIFPPPER